MDRRHRIYKLGIKLSKKYQFIASLMVSEYKKNHIPYNQKEYTEARKKMYLANRAILSVDPNYFSQEHTDWYQKTRREKFGSGMTNEHMVVQLKKLK